MRNTSKLLLYCTLFLILVTIGELYYLFVINNNNKFKDSTTKIVREILPNTPLAFKVIPTPHSPSPTASDSDLTLDFMASKDEVDALKDLIKNKLVTSTIFETRWNGLIKDIALETLHDSKNLPFNVFSFNIYSTVNNQKKRYFAIAEFTYDKVETVQIVNGKEKAISLRDFKNGDKVELTSRTNLFYPIISDSYMESPAFDHMKIVKL